MPTYTKALSDDKTPHASHEKSLRLAPSLHSEPSSRPSPLQPARTLLPVLALFLSLAGMTSAQGFENGRVELVRATFGSGNLGANAALEFQSEMSPILTYTPVAEAPGSSLISLYPGYLAPATDRRGLITDGRITDILLGREDPA